jgi:hypothetical protein
LGLGDLQEGAVLGRVAELTFKRRRAIAKIDERPISNSSAKTFSLFSAG